MIEPTAKTEEFGITGDNDPSHPDNQHHAWSNYCLYCHTENYDPAAHHGLRLWHYCYRCVLICRECGEEKPLYAFAYDFESKAYKGWKTAYKAGGEIFRQWRMVNSPFSNMGHATNEAHINLCCHCDNRHVDERERLGQEAATEKRLATARKHQEMMDDPSAAAALDAILKGLEQ